MTHPLDLEALKRLAEGATRGEWTEGEAAVEHVNGTVCTCHDLNHIGDSEANAAYIAAANPAVILALVAEVERLQFVEEGWITEAGADRARAESAESRLAVAVTALERICGSSTPQALIARATLQALARLGEEKGDG